MKNNVIVYISALLILALSVFGCVSKTKKGEDVTYDVEKIGFIEEGVFKPASFGLKIRINEEEDRINVFDGNKIDDVFAIDSVSYDSYNGVKIKMIHTHHESSIKVVYGGYKFTFAMENIASNRKSIIMLIDDCPDTIMGLKQRSYEFNRKS